MIKLQIELPEQFRPFLNDIEKQGLSIKEYCQQELKTEIESRNLDNEFKYFDPKTVELI